MDNPSFLTIVKLLPQGFKLFRNELAEGRLELMGTPGLPPFENEVKLGPLFLDFEKIYNYHLRTFKKINTHPFKRALKVNPGVILESHGGFGADSMLWLFLGHRLITWEASEVVSSMLLEARERALKNGGAKLQALMENWVINPSAFSPHKGELQEASAIYLDPMYPGHEKRKTKPAKEMIYLRALASADVGENDLWDRVKDFHGPLIVKRPPSGDFLWKKPHHSIESKALRLDIYLPALGEKF